MIIKIGSKEFDTDSQVYIMGILNVTPDSFSDGGRYLQKEAALRQAEDMIRQGAAVIDVGGESTRPGYEKISEDEEMHRVMPVIEAIRARFDVLISLDTYKASVAREGILAGADLINDIWGLKADKAMAGVIAEGKVSCVLMHNRSNPVYEDLMTDICSDLKDSVRLALQAGISEERIILDPGIGFAKDTAQNLSVLGNLRRLKELSFPVLLAASRKSVIGNTLSLPVNERLEGTLALTAAGVLAGAFMIRAHDVQENLRAAQMALAVRRVGEDFPAVEDERAEK